MLRIVKEERAEQKKLALDRAQRIADKKADPSGYLLSEIFLMLD